MPATPIPQFHEAPLNALIVKTMVHHHHFVDLTESGPKHLQSGHLKTDADLKTIGLEDVPLPSPASQIIEDEHHQRTPHGQDLGHWAIEALPRLLELRRVSKLGLIETTSLTKIALSMEFAIREIGSRLALRRRLGRRVVPAAGDRNRG